MRVVYFAKTSEQGPSSRYRIYQFVPFLEAAAIRCSVRPLFGRAYFALLTVRAAPVRMLGKALYTAVRFAKRAWDLATMGRPDIVVIEGQLFPYCPPWAERLLRGAGLKLVVEFDDAIYLTPGHRRKIPALLATAWGAIVGNETLAQYARRHTARVCVVPTVVDTRRFVPVTAAGRSGCGANEGPVTVVWIGLAYNLGYLDMVAPVLKELQDKGWLKFRAVCSMPPRWPGLAVEFRPWQLAREVEDLRGGQIGIMPLPATPWAEGKCGLKLLQYMSLGMAAIASPVGVNRDIVSDGENGFLAATEQEWYEKLARLCRDPTLRERVGRAARKTVEARYSLQAWGPRLAEQYRAIAKDAAPVPVEPSIAESFPRCR